MYFIHTVSQICSFICLPSIVIILAPNSTPKMHNVSLMSKVNSVFTMSFKNLNSDQKQSKEIEIRATYTDCQIMDGLKAFVSELK